MSVLDDVMAQPTGARFYRGDLHIHSFGASHDVKDTAMTAAAIVQTAVWEGLSIIAVTDHNQVASVEAALKASSMTRVTVIPAVELSTSQGHLLLCYRPSARSPVEFCG